MDKKKTITDIILEGMVEAKKAAIKKAIETNTSIVVWEDGKVKKIPPEILVARCRELGWDLGIRTDWNFKA